MFDIFAKRYGIKSPDEFYDNYTMKQVAELLPVIDEANHCDFEISAKLAGQKVKPRLKPLNISKEKRSEYNKQALSKFEQMKQDYEKNKG